MLKCLDVFEHSGLVLPKVQVSMKFDGQSSVELHPHSNLEDLKTVTSISLFMRVDPDKDPIEDRFVLYLGDRNVRNPTETNFFSDLGLKFAQKRENKQRKTRQIQDKQPGAAGGDERRTAVLVVSAF